MAKPPDRKELIAELAAARAALTAYATAVRHDLDLGARLKRSFQTNRTAWLGGAAVLGLLLSKVPSTRRKVVIHAPSAEAGKAGKAGLLLLALKFGLNFAKPALLVWVKDRWLGRSAKRSEA